MNRRALIGIAGIALATAAGGVAWHSFARQRAAIRAALPPEPNLSGWPAILHQRLAAASKGSVQGLEELSRLYHANGFYREAIACYEKLEALQPHEPRWLHRHATILAGYGEAEPAIALWRRVLLLAPDYIPTRLRLGDLLLKSNRSAEAAAEYAEVLRQKPDNPYALLGLARLDLEAGRWDEARTKLEKIVAATNYTLGYDLIVTVYEHFGQNEQAAAIRARDKASGAYRDPADPWIDELVAECYDPYRLSTLAGFAAGRGETATAINLLRRAIDLSPDDPSPHFQLGMLAMEQRNYDEAFEQLGRCTTLAPDFSDGWIRLSELQARVGDTVSADRTLIEGLEHCPNSPGLHLSHARTLRKAGHVGEAIAEFKASIRLRPNEPDAYVELGNMLIELGRADEGLAELEQSLDAQPDNPGALAILAFHAITTGNETEAQKWLARVRRQPRIPTDQITALRNAYHQQFGHGWVP